MTYTPEQTKANRDKWTIALRSDKYQQWGGSLTNFDRTSFCCLGVACDISGLGAWHGSYYEVEGKYSRNGLPEPVRDWLGLNSTLGSFEFEDRIRALSTLNDDNATFDEIADIIDSEPDGLIAK